MRYLAGYPGELLAQVAQRVQGGTLGSLLRSRYAAAHDVRTDRALFAYVDGLRIEFMRNAPPLSRVAFDSKLHVIRNALGTHTTISRVQGGKLKAKREIRVATLFKEVPIEWLRMIVVHELAHMKQREHDKAFYALCTHMEPAYHRFEFDLRLYLTHLEAGGEALWPIATPAGSGDGRPAG
ncbi:MAG: M48 family peptidase [Comamonadaceae bacterium]|nr:MAG: M48 family peptidase [Comamonadaceae bacterium]